MKKLFLDIPIVTKSIIIISILIYIINFSLYFFNISNINEYFGLYHYTDDKFKIYQILTFSFSHDINPSHIFYNIVYFLLISIECEKILKNNFIKLIVFTIIINIVFIQFPLIDSFNIKFIGLSTITFSIMSCFIFIKNNLPNTLSFCIKLLCFSFIIGEILNVLTCNKNDMYLHYPHMCGIASGLIFSLIILLYMRIVKKGQ
jgi:membrane associated rhomboid family serine protease